MDLATYWPITQNLGTCIEIKNRPYQCGPTRAPTWGSAAPGKSKSASSLPPGSGKDHLLFLLFTKSAASPKSATPGHFPNAFPSRGPEL